MKPARSSAAALLLLLPAAPAPAAPSSTPSPEILRQGELGQADVLARTRLLRHHLDTLIGEFRQNGIDGEEVKALTHLRDNLDKLGNEEMEHVLELLREAVTQHDPKRALGNVSEAYSGQKFIASRVRQLVAAYERNQAAHVLAKSFEALARRQDANLQTAIEFGRWAQGRKEQEVEAVLKASVDAQVSEQEAIGEETLIGLSKLKQLANASATNDNLRRAAALAEQADLPALLHAAPSELAALQFDQAAEIEKTVHDRLRALSRLLSLPANPAESLRETARELAQLADAQRKLAADTQAARDPNEFTRLEDRQADLVRSLDRLQHDLAATASRTPPELDRALEALQAARKELLDRDRRDAITHENAAATALATAEAAFERELAAATPLQPTDPAAALAALKEQTTALRQQQQQTMEQGLAAGQNPAARAKQAASQQMLASQAHSLAQAAATTAPAAAQSLDNAARQMQAAGQALATPGQVAAPAQNAALQQLARAEQQLGQAAQQLQQLMDQMAAASDLLGRLVEIIQEQQRIEAATAKAELTPDKAHQIKASGELAVLQGMLKSTAEALQADLVLVVPAAARPLANAGREMNNARKALETFDPAGARAPEQHALAALYETRDLLATELAAMQQALGQPAAETGLDQMGQLPDQAAARLGLAVNQMADGSQAGAEQAAQTLDQAAATAGQAAAQAPAGAPSGAVQAAQSAQAAAAQAQNALAAAQAALAMAASGLSASQGQGEGQSQAPTTAMGGSGGKATYGGPGGTAAEKGTLAEIVSQGRFLGLPARDRDAIRQSQAEKYPEEFATMVEQYMRNLSDESTPSR